MKKTQQLIKKTFLDNFSKTPLKERMDDILRESLELVRFTDINNMKEETGDLLASVLMLCNENEWNVTELIKKTCEKINRRSKQYKSLGRKYKIALLGGGFNPITKAHIEVAQYVLNTSGQFDEIWLVPAYKHMYNKKMVSYENRFKMCEFAAEIDGRIKVFDYEKRKNLAGETYHLLKTLLNDHDYENYNFSFIIGLDNANTFDKWINYEELERMVRFIVVPRHGYTSTNNSWYFNFPHLFLNGNNEHIPIEISSTQIRNKMKEYWKTDFKAVVESEIVSNIDKKVMNFIKEKKLYKNDKI